LKALQLSHYPINLGDTVLHLLPQNAIFWPEENTLLVADLHLGKEHVFGRRGIAIPEGPSNATLNNLSTLLHNTGASDCVVLGDFFHDTPRSNDSWLSAVSHFLDDHPNVTMQITAGNHDKQIGQSLIDSRLVWHNEPLYRGSLVLQHEPGSDSRGHVLAGHLHPVVSIGDKFQRTLRSRCFWHQPHCTVLPAFGQFTGGYQVTPAPSDQVFLADTERVIAVPHNAIARSKRRSRTEGIQTP